MSKAKAAGNQAAGAQASQSAATAEVENWFVYHPPKDGQAETYQSLRDQAKAFAEGILASCPDFRERSLALTKLREAVMWANASIACHG